MKTLLQTLFFFLLATHFCLAQWYQQNSGTPAYLNSVHFEDINIGWTVGTDGTILKTTNGGTIWTQQLSGTTGGLNGVSSTDTNNGIVVGDGGKILTTTNGGTIWIEQSSGTTERLTSVFFADANNGWVVGDVGTILRTTNSGSNWVQQSSGTSDLLTSIHFTDTISGTAVGSYDTILRTTNGGTTWTQQSSGALGKSVFFPNANNGFIVGGGCWWSCWGVILGTTNGGNDWSILVDTLGAILNSIFFIDANNGWVVGWSNGNGIDPKGKIFRTTNGGQEWVDQTSGTSNWLCSVSFSDPNNGWTVGHNGTILHTTNGGVPVELTSFRAKANGKEVILNWSTATELNNQGFEIERASSSTTPVQEWKKIGFVPGFGTTTEPKIYSFTDQSVNNGINYYRLKQVDYDGSYEYSDVVEVEFIAFDSYLLEQNYPNPFNPTTIIGFGIQNKSNVKLTILNTIGEEVIVVLNEEKESGFHKVDFNALSLPSGVYFYQLKAGEFVETKKMILLK